MTRAELVLLVIAVLLLGVSLVSKIVPVGKKAVLFSAGAVIVASLSALSEPAGGISVSDTATIDYTTIAAVLVWLSAAFFVTAVLKHAVYPMRLSASGVPTTPLLLQRLISSVVYLAVLTGVLQFVLDTSVTAIVTASGVVALILGYSSRNIIEQFFSGIAITADDPFQMGDLIQINGEWGWVHDVSWRSITYLDTDDNYVVVPNSVVTASNILNLDRPDQTTRRTMTIRVEYNVPPRVVIDEIEAAMKECPHIADHPWNYAAFLEFDEIGMKYRIAFYLNHYNDWFVASDELFNVIWYRFARKQIRFAHHRNLNYIGSEDEKRGLYGSAYDEARWRDLVARFKEVPMFEGMTVDDMEELAQLATLRVMGPPELIMVAGSETTSLFLVAEGIADQFEVDEKGAETWMATVSHGDTVGLMSMLTGAPPRTTVRARTEVAVWEIHSESLHALFERKPEVMTNIAGNVARWQAEEDQTLNQMASGRNVADAEITSRTIALKKRIAGFFDRRNDDGPDVIEAPPPDRAKWGIDVEAEDAEAGFDVEEHRLRR